MEHTRLGVPVKIETIVVGAFEVNCFMAVGVGQQAIVIDPGADADQVLAVLEAHRLSVAAYVLTHGHVDHVSGVADLYDRHPAQVAMHQADLAWAFSAQNAMPPYYAAPRRPAAIARSLRGGEEFNDAGLSYRIVATPGHSPGSVCVHFEGEQVLFAGDTLFAGSVGRTDLPGGSARTLSASLKILAQLADDTVVYPGHGPSTTIGAEKQANPFMRGMG
jgi:hydroxyacylglutathione hydrolase